MLSTDVFGEGSGPVFLGDVQCVGNELGLLECTHNGIGDHSCGQEANTGQIQSAHQFDVAILCSGKVIPTPSQHRMLRVFVIYVQLLLQ